MDRSQVQHRAKPFPLSVTLGDNLGSSMNPTSMFSVCERKPEYLEKTRVRGRTYELHTESPEGKHVTLLL